MAAPAPARVRSRPQVAVLPCAPEDLLRGRLARLGEGVGKVVYASPHWVVKRLRQPTEILALILVWKALRRVETLFPPLRRFRERPSRQLRFLRFATQGALSLIPRTWWYTSHAGELMRQYRAQTRKGERLAETRLAGTDIVPATVGFPPVTVRVAGWPGYLTVSEATERVEANLYEHLSRLARRRKYEQVELWLNRFLDLRMAGWARGVFSVDAHLKNFGVIGDRVVLIDTGGLTDRWPEITSRLAREEQVEEPHRRLGLGPLLARCPAVATRFDARWRETVNPRTVRRQWPEGDC